MSLQVKCPQCQTSCIIAETAANHKVRCPRCQGVFQPNATQLSAESALSAKPAPPRRSRDKELIPPPRKPSRGGELIPPSPDGPSIKKTPSFAEREIKDFVIFAIVGAITSAIVLGIAGLVAGWYFLK